MSKLFFFTLLATLVAPCFGDSQKPEEFPLDSQIQASYTYIKTDPEKSLKILSGVIEKLKDDPAGKTMLAEAYLAQATVYVAASQAEPALKSLDSLISIDPDNFLGRFRRGQVRGSMHDYKGSFEDLDIAKSLKPNDPELNQFLQKNEQYRPQ